MRIDELYTRGRPVYSFEFFPPKTDRGYASLFQTISDLKRLDPDFVSVTWGAVGSTRRKTVNLVIQIQQDIGITAMAHLTCVGSVPDRLAATVERLAAEGIENVLALRGDKPAGYVPPDGAFSYANELVSFLRARWDLCLGGACHPETHVEALDPEQDLHYLTHKVNAGLDFLITQLFFDNADYFRFVERARAAGIACPIVPGIMPVISADNVRRMAQLSGASIPAELEQRLAEVAHDPEETVAMGIEWATRQCRDLLERGAPGIHFYTLNRSPATRHIYQNLVEGREQ